MASCAWFKRWLQLLANHHKSKAFSLMGSSLLSAGKSVTMELGKLNHANFRQKKLLEAIVLIDFNTEMD